MCSETSIGTHFAMVTKRGYIRVITHKIHKSFAVSQNWKLRFTCGFTPGHLSLLSKTKLNFCATYIIFYGGNGNLSNIHHSLNHLVQHCMDLKGK